MKQIEIQKLVEIVKKLRDPVSGCPWDKVQTHKTLKKNLIEESYEVLDAIEKEDLSGLKEELGDLLLQVLLHAQIADDNKNFDVQEIIDYLSDKLVRRHPHVFGDKKAANPDEAIANWEAMKKQEKVVQNSSDKPKSILDGVPNSLPALFRAQKISERAAKVGFEWENLEGIRDQILEEIAEFTEEAIKENIDEVRMKDEFGDVFFSMIQLARRLKFDAEDLLQKSTDKFVSRFKLLEIEAASHNKEVSEFSLDELTEMWCRAKKKSLP